MREYTKERNANIMRLHTGSIYAVYQYVKPTVENCKCTFVDGSIYWQKIVKNDVRNTLRGEANTLYLDEACTVLANITRQQKIKELKKAGLN